MGKKKISNTIYVIIAFMAIGLGCIGIVVPILPTTPFLLLALFCFAKGSTRFYNWFVSSKLYNRYLQDFVTVRALKLKTKISLLLLVSIVLITTIILCNILWLRILLAVLLALKYYYFIFKIGTLKSKKSLEVSQNIK